MKLLGMRKTPLMALTRMMDPGDNGAQQQQQQHQLDPTAAPIESSWLSRSPKPSIPLFYRFRSRTTRQNKLFVPLLEY